MPIVQLVLSLIILSILYVRMIRRETPSPISFLQAAVPVLCGVLSLPVSFIIVLGIANLMKLLGISVKDAPLLIRGFLGAFLGAGFPEELAKLLFILLAMFLFRKKIRNVYEVVLIGAGVGFGFTLFEEFLYGSDLVTMITRILTIAAHMIFGIIMAEHLALAKYQKSTGKGSGTLHKILSFLLPVLIHTVFDAFTGHNPLLSGGDDDMMVIGVLTALGATVLLFILQFTVLKTVKKKAEEYSRLNLFL